MLINKILKNKVESYFKITNSLGIVNFDALYTSTSPKRLKRSVINVLERELTSLWKDILKSNIEVVELEPGYSTRNSSHKEAALIVSYNIKLDKRITDNMDTIMKMAQIINETLLEPNTLVYSNITADFDKTISFVLPGFLITCKINFFLFFSIK